ncbi:MAG: mandelate racemase/muconate lactonizing enzyme family protein [Chloroflexi bacterium]|nr:mandelate racemase/muconate lactonizing enzyme family protein [Chloroflexota bacterium]
MHIESISTRVVDLPLEKPYLSSLGRVMESIGHVLAEARSNEGHVGIGYAFSMDNSKLPVIKAAVDDLRRFAIGKDPFTVKSIWRSMASNAFWFGPGGLMNFAICAIDVAVWDLLGKITGRPLSLLLGGGREAVPCYRPGFWRSTPTSEFGAEAERYRKEGFKAVKLRVGGEKDLNSEVERVRAAREALGNDIDLMVDANQAWSAESALWVGDRIKKYDPFWLEDPVPYEDLEGRSRAAACIDIPIASGEEEYTRRGFLQLIEHEAADIFNLDLERVGGITGWLSVSAFLEARNKPFSCHLVPEIQCHLLATAEKGVTVEYMPWSFGLYREQPRVRDGLMVVPTGPGIGLEIDEAAIKKHEVK